jgi:XRE family aerobic/anaerobic benzoate catabolism transcriptional regulator
VIATPGGIVAEPATFNRLLAHCTTVWLQATPEEHMQRVMAQGDLRPMAGNREAMADLKRILDGRVAFYAKADYTLDTRGRTLAEADAALRRLVAPAFSAAGAQTKVDSRRGASPHRRMQAPAQPRAVADARPRSRGRGAR